MKRIYLLLILVAGAASAQMKTVNYKDDKTNLNGLFIPGANISSQKPGVLVLPAWMGIDDHAKRSAEKLARLGYHAFVADIYGEGNYPKDSKEAGERSGAFKKNYKDYERRISLALQQLIANGANPDNIAVIGYCFGGTGAIEAARAGLKVKGVVAFHGGLGKDRTRTNSPVQAKILVCHGADDMFVPEAEIDAFHQEMRDSKADYQMIYYADAVHGFTEPSAGKDKSKGVAYNELAAKRSWEHMLVFFKEILR